MSYCNGAQVTLYLTNATGASIGYAENLQIWPYLPLGWQVTGVALSNGYIVLDHLPPASCQARCSVGHSEEDMQT